VRGRVLANLIPQGVLKRVFVRHDACHLHAHCGVTRRGTTADDPAANVAAAVACFDRALTVRTQGAVPLEWAETQYNIGVTHHGGHGVGATEPADIYAAIACFRQALEVRTP